MGNITLSADEEVIRQARSQMERPRIANPSRQEGRRNGAAAGSQQISVTKLTGKNPSGDSDMSRQELPVLSPAAPESAPPPPWTLLENLPQGVYYVDRNRRIIHWSAAAERITGWRAEEVLGRFCGSGILEHVDEEGNALCGARCPLLMAAQFGAECCSALFLKHRAGHRLPVQIQAAPLRNGQGEIVGMVESFWDNSRQQHLLEEKIRLEKLLLSDPLTGVGNRRAGQEQLQRAIDGHQRYATPTGVVLFDLDYFKQVNDRYGHEAGDSVLRVVADTLALSLRSTDFLARWGGEEFLAALPNTEAPQLPQVVRRLLRMVERSYVEVPGTPIHVTASAGVTTVRLGDTVHSLVERADRMLYAAKHAGRNCLRIDGPENCAG